VQVQQALAVRYCDAVKPHIATVLGEWAQRVAPSSLEMRSSELLQAWGVTRAFEKKLMTSLEGIYSASSGDDDYDDLKRRAHGHLVQRQAGTPRPSLFHVCLPVLAPCLSCRSGIPRSMGLFSGCGMQLSNICGPCSLLLLCAGLTPGTP
jgi:hypothetical protein